MSVSWGNWVWDGTMYYIVKHRGHTFKIKNLMTDDGGLYIFRRCLDRDYNFKDNFQYILINAVGFGGILETDTLIHKSWIPFFVPDVHPYDPSLVLYDQSGVIKGNAVDINIPNDGAIAGFAVVGSMVLSVAIFDFVQTVRRGDNINLSYNIEL